MEIHIERHPGPLSRDRIVTGFVLAIRVTPGEEPEVVELPPGTSLHLEDVEDETALIQARSEWFHCHMDELLEGSQAKERVRAPDCTSAPP